MSAFRALAKDISVPILVKPAFRSTSSDPMLSLAARAYSGRTAIVSRNSARARLATPCPQTARSIQ